MIGPRNQCGRYLKLCMGSVAVGESLHRCEDELKKIKVIEINLLLVRGKN
jgi:hypothetical protein